MTKANDNSVPLTRIQKLIGKRMLQSKQQIPCFYLQANADLTDLAGFRKGYCRKAGIRAGTNDFFLMAMAKAIKQFPLMAGQIQGDKIKIADSIGVGIAVASPTGLVVPVIHDAQSKNLSQIAADSKQLIQKARNSKLSLDDLSGGCICLSSLGMFGITSFVAIVPPGQVSILSVGKIVDTAVPGDNGIRTRKLMSCTLAVDHKIANGAYASNFLMYIINMLENPKLLVQ